MRTLTALPLLLALAGASLDAADQKAAPKAAPQAAAAKAAPKAASAPKTWAADNGNGTYSNPLFYDEFSDPDMIRVGDDYYLTGTTMHTMPGLPILHSKDLVNWKTINYALDRLDLGPDMRLEGGKTMYGKGIWAPCFRYNKGTFYIFANVNGHGLQVYRTKDVRGKWQHNEVQGLHDLSVLFDDDGKIYVIWGATEIRIAEFNQELTAVVPGTERVLIARNLGMGEGSHFYKINGKYYIVSAMPGAHVPMKCARADKLTGPWEVEIISQESFGIGQGWRPAGRGRTAGTFKNNPPDLSERLSLNIHQGGIIQTQKGEWWGYSMMDHNSVGRLTTLSPVTWENGWPYFGLKGNLKRTPAIWVKPDTGFTGPVTAPYERSDDFSGPKLQMVWQWNHVPDDNKWSLDDRKGYLRLNSLPGTDFWNARNTLTQRVMGPESIVTTELDASGLKAGDVAGLGLLNVPWAWIGVKKEGAKYTVQQYDFTTDKSATAPLAGSRVWLNVKCDFDTEHCSFGYSEDGKIFKLIGDEFVTVFQLTTFQGVRYALFNYNTTANDGGAADFNSFQVDEPRNRGLTKPIPLNSYITITDLGTGNALAAVDGKLQVADAAKATRFRVVDRGRGRIALKTQDGKFVSVSGAGKTGEVALKAAAAPGNAETFQWVDLHRGDTLFLSLATNRYILAPKAAGAVSADYAGPEPSRKDGSCFSWTVIP
jgi:xylan 1,4-beta-xylosidase